MRRHARIGAKGDFDAVSIGLGKRALDCRANFACFGPNQVREEPINFRFFRNEFTRDDGRHVVGSSLLHGLHHRFVHERTMLDGVHTGFHRPKHALSAMRVRGHFEAIILCGVDDGFKFIRLELGILTIFSLRQYATGCRNLDEV